MRVGAVRSGKAYLAARMRRCGGMSWNVKHSIGTCTYTLVRERMPPNRTTTSASIVRGMMAVYVPHLYILKGDADRLPCQQQRQEEGSVFGVRGTVTAGRRLGTATASSRNVVSTHSVGEDWVAMTYHALLGEWKGSSGASAYGGNAYFAAAGTSHRTSTAALLNCRRRRNRSLQRLSRFPSTPQKPKT